MTRDYRIVIQLVAALACTAGVAPAATTYTWDAAGGGVWNDSGHWSPAGPPVNGDTTVFGAVGSGQTNTLDVAGLNLVELFLQQGAHTTNLNGNTLDVSILRVVNAGLTSGSLTLTGTGTLNVAGQVVIGTGDRAVGVVHAGDNVTVNIGVDASNRASLLIGQTANAGDTSVVYNDPSELVSTGTFHAYLSSLILGKDNRNIGRLDLTSATGVLDVDGLVQLGGGGGRPRGDLIAGSGMTVNIQAAGLVVSDGANVAGQASGPSLLDLSQASGALHVTGQIIVGRSRGMAGSVIVGADVAFTADVNTLEVGRQTSLTSVTGTLDLSDVVGGSLHVQDTLHVGYRTAGSSASGSVTLGDGLDVSLGTPGDRAVARIGATTNGTTNANPASGSFVLGAATFDAYLTELRVGNATDAADINVDGLLDLSRATAGVLDVAGDVLIGVSAGGSNIGGRAILAHLTASANSVQVGHTFSGAANRESYLDLRDTTFTVNNALNIQGVSATHRGRVLITVDDTSSGLDLVGTATLAVGSFGLIDITFGTPDGSEPIYWGLRWDGDHTAQLQQLAGDGLLTWNDAAVILAGYDPVSIFSEGGFTYVGTLIPAILIPEPSGLALAVSAAACLLARRRRR